MLKNKEHINEEDIVQEASRWDCEVREEKEDNKIVYKVYETIDKLWVATFQDELAANEFAKAYPKMKEKYLKQAAENEAAKQMVEQDKQKTIDDISEKELDEKIEEALKEIYN